MRRYINTVEDMEQYYYGKGAGYIKKIDAPMLSTTSGVYNAVHGANVWVMLNQEANAFGMLPKYVWTNSGWRLITARGGTVGDGGIAENGTLPDTLMPTIEEVKTKPKTIGRTFDVSEVHEFLSAESDDDAVGDMQFNRQYWGVQHKEDMNVQLLKDVDTLADVQLESIDRVCSNTSEANDATIALGANDADIYGLDRDGVSTYDAYVDHNSAVDRALTDILVRTAINTIQENGGNTKIILTGYDTYSKCQDLYDDNIRYNVLGEASIKVGVNGVDTKDGYGFGVDIATLYGKPFLQSKNVTKDTISRMYFLDTSDPEGFGIPRLGLKIAKPTQYFEAGMSTGDPFGINRLGNEGLYRTMGELICTALHAQGKIRDLKT